MARVEPKRIAQATIRPAVDLGRLHVDLGDILGEGLTPAIRADRLLRLLAALTRASVCGYLEADATGRYRVQQLLMVPELRQEEEAIGQVLVKAAGQARTTGRLAAEPFSGTTPLLTLASTAPMGVTGHAALGLLLPASVEPPEQVILVLQTMTAALSVSGIAPPAASLDGSHLVNAFADSWQQRAEVLASSLASLDHVREAFVARMAAGAIKGSIAVAPPRTLDPRAPGGDAVVSALRQLQPDGHIRHWADGDEAGLPLQRAGDQLAAAGLVTFALAETSKSQLAALVIATRADAAAKLATALRAQAPLLRAAAAAPAKRSRKQVRLSRGMALSIGLTLAALAALAVPIDRTITAETELAPRERRYVTAPFPALVEDVAVRIGDPVTAGMVLARLDAEPMLLQREALRAEQREWLRRREVALLERRPAEAEIMRLEGERVTSELALAEQRLEQLAIISPIDGVVLAGELDRAIGASVGRGDVMFELAPTEQVLAIVHIPILDVALFDQAAGGDLHLDGRPGPPLAIAFERVRPRAEVRDGINGLVAEATLSAPDLRPGQRGEAVLPAGQATLAEILFRRPLARLIRWWR